MPAIRARLDDVIARVRADIAADVKSAAGNHLLSKSEAAAAPSKLVRDGDEQVRSRGGFNTRVTTTEATDAATAIVEKNIAAINQVTGAGKTFISVEEIQRLQGVDSETAQRAAKAYELITGRRVVLDGTLPSPATSDLPQRATVALTDVLVDHFGLARAARVTVKDVRAVDGGFAFKVESNVFAGDAFAREIDGRFVVAGKPFSAADFALVKREALQYFDQSFAPEMEQWGSTPEEIADARKAFIPERGFLAGESDPYDHASSYPLVFQIANETGSDHGVYAGFDPSSRVVDIYAFN
jgi:hypothetical protein